MEVWKLNIGMVVGVIVTYWLFGPGWGSIALALVAFLFIADAISG